MAISPTSFFDLQTQMQSETRLRNQSDTQLSNSFMGLSSVIMRLSRELSQMTSFVSAGQKQENKILSDMLRESEISSLMKKPDLESDFGGVSGGMLSGETGKSSGGLSSLLAGGAAAGGLAAVLASVLGGRDEPIDTSGDLSGSGNAEKSFNYFVSRGYSKEQSAALVGNFLQENSTLNPNTTNSIGHKGIAQWDPDDRYPKLVKFSESKGMKPNTLEAQLQYVEHELSTGNHGLSKSRLQGTKGLEEATKLVRTHYLRPGESEARDDNRLRNAQNVLKRYGGNSQSTSKSSASSSKPSTSPSSSQIASASSQTSENGKDTKYDGGPTKDLIKVSSSQIAAAPKESAVTEPPPDTSQGMIASYPQISAPVSSDVSPRGSALSTGSPDSGNPLSTIASLSMGIQVG